MMTWRQKPQGYDDPVLEAKRREAIERMGEQWLLHNKGVPRLPRRLNEQEAQANVPVVQRQKVPVPPLRHLKRVA
jgi:hypothetical protein